MKKTLIVFFVLIFSGSISAQKSQYTIHLELSGLPDTALVSLIRLKDKKNEVDQVMNSFSYKKTFTGSVDEATLFYIHIHSQTSNGYMPITGIPLFIENEEVKIIGDIGDYKIITESETQQVLSLWEEKRENINAKIQKYQRELYEMNLNGEFDSLKYEDAFSKYNAFRKKEEELIVEFISQNLDSETAVYLLSAFYYRLPRETVCSLYDEFNKNILHNSFFKELELYTSTEELIAGDKWYDFEAFDTKGDRILLSKAESIQGKYILLVFSSPGCQPCEKSITELKEIYTKYYKELEIVTYNQDISIAGLARKASEKEIDWTFLGTTDRSDNRTLFTYGSFGVPKFVLISPERRVIYSWDIGYEKGLLTEKVEEFLGS